MQNLFSNSYYKDFFDENDSFMLRGIICVIFLHDFRRNQHNERRLQSDFRFHQFDCEIDFLDFGLDLR